MNIRTERLAESFCRKKLDYLWKWASVSKTAITLTAIERLLFEEFAVYRVLVIAPKRVAEDTWTREHQKWDHLSHLRVSRVLGSAKEREQALKADSDVYVIGRDNVVWLTERYQNAKQWPFDMVVIDELSSFKNPQAKRFRALRKVLPATERVVGLTGTPAANGLMDLWAEMYLLDRGERLGRTLTDYRTEFFNPGKRNGFVVFEWKPKSGALEKIQNRISDICVSMKANDYLQMPDRVENVVAVHLSDSEKKLYQKMEKEQLLLMESGEEVVALSAAACMNKLLQMANGRVYTDSKEVVDIHKGKLEALEELVEASDSPVLVFYGYQHDKTAIQEKLPYAVSLDSSEDIARWNDGKIRVLLAHPASVSYGLNLQDGGHTVVWYGLTWSLEQYQQANARLYRQGQKHTVFIYHIVTAGTVDEQVMKALEQKDVSQTALMNALKERRKCVGI